MPEVAPTPVATPQMVVVDPFSMPSAPPPDPQAPPTTDPLIVAPPQAQQPPAAPAIAPEPTQTPAVAPPAPVDPLDQSISQLIDGQKPFEMDDAFKSKFKELMGIEDPLKFKDDWTKSSTETELLRKDAMEARAVRESLSKLSPAAQRLLQLEMEGKSNDAISYLRSLPDVVLQNKPADELSPEILLKTYRADMFTPEEWTALKTGNYEELGLDPEMAKKTLDWKVNGLLPMAKAEHETARASIASQATAHQQQRAAAQEGWDKAVTNSIAHAKQSPLSVYVDQSMIDGFLNGQVEHGLLVESDGVTPSPNRLESILKAKLYDSAVKRASELGYQRGKQDGLQEATSQLPNSPPGRTAVAHIPDANNKDAATQWLDQVEQNMAKR